MSSDLESRLAGALTALADLTADADLRPEHDALADVEAATRTKRRSALTPWVRPVLAAVAVAAVLAATFVGVARLRTSSDAPPALAPTVEKTAVEMPPVKPTTVASGSAGPAQPGAARVAGDFVDDSYGWMLSASARCSGCLDLAKTTDGGANWTRLPQPPAELSVVSTGGGLAQIYFADRDTGYLFGGQNTFVTRNGGQTWDAFVGIDISAMVTAGGYTYGLTDPNPSGAASTMPAVVWRAAIHGNGFTKVDVTGQDGKTGHSWSLKAQNDELVLLRTDGPATPGQTGSRGALWSSSDNATTWQQRPTPCGLADGGAAAVSIALDHPLAWLVDCFARKQSQQAEETQHHLYGTSDGGGRWVRLGDPSASGDPAVLADNGAGHAFLATVSGSHDAVLASLDGGQIWQPAISSPSGVGGFQGWADLKFVSSSVGYALEQNDSTGGILYRTTDGGATWQKRSVPAIGK